MAELDKGEYKVPTQQSGEHDLFDMPPVSHRLLAQVQGGRWCPCKNRRQPDLCADEPPQFALLRRPCESGTRGGENLSQRPKRYRDTYDPHRIIKVLKRKPGTPRGGGQWVTIDFNAAINEIVEGGDLFGEGHVQGLKEVYVLRDRSVAKAMAEDVGKIRKKSMTVEEFKSKHSAQLNTLIDPNTRTWVPRITNSYSSRAAFSQAGPSL